MLNILKLLEPALTEKSIAMVKAYYVFMEDRIMAYNGWIWTVILFPIGLTGLVKGKALCEALSAITARMIDLSVSDTGEMLQIKGGDTTAGLPFHMSEDHYNMLKRRIPKDSNWIELPSDLLRGLEFGAEFAAEYSSYSLELVYDG